MTFNLAVYIFFYFFLLPVFLIFKLVVLKYMDIISVWKKAALIGTVPIRCVLLSLITFLKLLGKINIFMIRQWFLL